MDDSEEILILYNVTPPIEIEIKLPEPLPKEHLACAYWDGRAWSLEGMTS